MTEGSNSQNLSPFVYWAQNEKQITLKVDLHDVKEPNIDLQTRSIKFCAYGSGARSYGDYKFSINLYEDISIEESSYKIFDSKIEFVIKKDKIAWWPRLTAQPQKPHWLKIDFDRWRSEEDGDLDETRDIMEDYPGVHDNLQKQEYGYRKEQGKKVYLLFYNLFQFVGFLYVFLVILIRYYRDGADSISGTYDAVGSAAKFCSLLQYLEVMHPLFGYTKGSALAPFIQVSGRCAILIFMIDWEERMQPKPVVFYLLLVWTLIEVVRYPYYITTIINKPIGILTWLRYTIWIPLYPAGILCEAIVILRNIPYFEETKRLTIELPNAYNFTFSMPLMMKLWLVFLLLPGIYFAMNHMAKQRIKVLGTKSKKIRKD